MKVVILAGGFGTRLAEETEIKPKPMVEIGGRPMLWHIMKSYAADDVHEFVVCAGYKSEQIKRYFLDYYSTNGDLTVDLRDGRVSVRRKGGEDWVVHIVDTGLET